MGDMAASADNIDTHTMHMPKDRPLVAAA